MPPSKPNPATPKNPDPAAPAEAVSYFAHVKLWLTGLVGVLVVLPSLVNAGLDVYSSLLKLPKTEAERINEKLFRDNFGKQPVATIPVPIKQNNGLVEVRFQIYEKGDVFVQFGNFSQWFPFPSTEEGAKKSAGFSLLSSAFAETPAPQPPQGMGQYQQIDKMQDGAILRETTYENGVVQSQVIDTRSGDILDSSSRKIEQKPLPPVPSPAPVVPKVVPIDLDHYRSVARDKISSSAPVKGATALWQQALTNELAWCEKKDWGISRYLCTYRARSKWCDQPTGAEQIKACAN
ncbi:MAG: hypothetical protein NTZ64_05035 [Polaromonas sp.]|nr:hypothetical protein [Polaromonas sp.]